MFIRVLLPNKEEGLFNGNCLVAGLLDAIKREHQLPRSEVIDLCTTDGHVKNLCYHLGENGSAFFQLRELCLVVKVYEADTSHPYYIPALPEYADNAEFVEVVNHMSEKQLCVRVRLKNRLPKPESPSRLRPSDKSRGRRRKLSSVRT